MSACSPTPSCSVRKGVEYARDKNYAYALKYYSQALSFDPKNVDAIVATGAALANQDKLQEAVAQFEKAVRLDPNHPNAQTYLDKTREKVPRVVWFPNMSNEDLCRLAAESMLVRAGLLARFRWHRPASVFSRNPLFPHRRRRAP